MTSNPFSAHRLVFGALKSSFSNIKTFIQLALAPLFVVVLNNVLLLFPQNIATNLLSIFCIIASAFLPIVLCISSIRFAGGKPLGQNLTKLTTGGVFWRLMLLYIKIFSIYFLIFLSFFSFVCIVGYALNSDQINQFFQLNLPYEHLFAVIFGLIQENILFLSISLFSLVFIGTYLSIRWYVAIPAACLGDDPTLKNSSKLTYHRYWFIIRTQLLYGLIQGIVIFLVVWMMALITKPTNHPDQQRQVSSLITGDQEDISPYEEAIEDTSYYKDEANMMYSETLEADVVSEVSSTSHGPIVSQEYIHILSSFILEFFIYFTIFSSSFVFVRIYEVLKENQVKRREKNKN